MAYWNPVEISTKGGTLVMQFLPEDVKHRMGGEEVVYFYAERNCSPLIGISQDA
jgi:hypothetical protein